MNDEYEKYSKIFGKYLNLGNSAEMKYIYDIYKDAMKNEYEPEISDEMIEAKEKRKERKLKLKRVFNYDDEMGFLKSFLKLKSKDIKSGKTNLDDFLVLCKQMFVDTEQVSDVIFEYFEEEMRLLRKLKSLQKLQEETEAEIDKINELLNDDDDDDDIDNIKDDLGDFGADYQNQIY